MDSHPNFKEFEYLSNFEFPVACNDLCFSESRRRLLATGVYKPSVKLFDMKSSTMKFERHLVSDPLRILSLEEDAEKFAILRNDKAIEFHIKSGLHEQIKVPTQPKDMLLNKVLSELYVGGGHGEIYRFSLEQGRFLKSIPCKGANSISLSRSNGLLGAVAGNNMTFFDSRTRNEVFSRKYDNEILCIGQDESGLKYAIGTELGEILEYDLRSPSPLRKVCLGDFVKKITYHKSLLASTSSSVSIVLEDCTVSNITPGFAINAFDTDGGVVFIGGESPAMKGYFSEELGSLPSWLTTAM